MLDSLVRVSRRVVWNHFVNIQSAGVTDPPGYLTRPAVSKLSTGWNRKAMGYPKSAAVLSPTRGMTGGYKHSERIRATFHRLFTPDQTDVDPSDRQVHRAHPFRDPRLITCRQYWFQAFPFWQFHVLFNSLFKVLFIFPSRYLFAIGLSPIFSFRWYLPPVLDSNPKLPDSWKTYHMGANIGS